MGAPGRLWRFLSAWTLSVDTTEAWGVLSDIATWPQWWPGLRMDPVRTGGDGWVGQRALVSFRAPGYRLRLGLEVTDADPATGPGAPAAVVLRAVGDLRGEARAHIVATTAPGRVGPSCLVSIDWRVRAAHPGLRVGERLAPWALRASHAHVMAAGERGLRRYLER